jgi:hypothetical protein
MKKKREKENKNENEKKLRPKEKELRMNNKLEKERSDRPQGTALLKRDSFAFLISFIIILNRNEISWKLRSILLIHGAFLFIFKAFKFTSAGQVLPAVTNDFLFQFLILIPIHPQKERRCSIRSYILCLDLESTHHQLWNNYFWASNLLSGCYLHDSTV